MGKILFGAAYSVIEPLGLLHLGGLARDMGFERSYCLVKDQDFTEFHYKVIKEKPDFIAFNVYTGNHITLYDYFSKLKKEFSNIKTILGGPHPSYFPFEASQKADYVVMSEGFAALYEILSGTAKLGVQTPKKSNYVFPHPDRIKFYEDYPKHGRSTIKSIITMTGCPFRCTYCYNSSDIKSVIPGLSNEIVEEIGNKRLAGRLFPWNTRTVDAVIKEGKELKEKYPTKMIYFQDDVFGMKIEWLEEFAKRWPKEVGIRWHAQMRWEMTVEEVGKKRLRLCKDSGCCGLTMAIEAADEHIRKEVLDRQMPQEMIFEGMKNCVDCGFKIRTEQITGLPYGATSVPTRMNLSADLEILELNVSLREKTGGPHLAWASTFVPYARTRLGKYSVDLGFYENPQGENWDIKDTFFEKSVLRFLKKHVGPSLIKKSSDAGIWLTDEELETYRKQNAELRRHFNIFAYLDEGHEFAQNYITQGNYSFEKLGDMIRTWTSISREAEEEFIKNFQLSQEKSSIIRQLAPYFLVVPNSVEFAQRFIDKSDKKGFTMDTLSEAARHHLYEYVVYQVADASELIPQATTLH